MLRIKVNSMSFKEVIIKKQENSNYLKKVRGLSLLLVILGLIGCSNQTQEEKIAAFNKRYVLEYQLSSTHLPINWKADK